MNELMPIEKEAIRLRVEKCLVRSSFFSICDIDQCATTAGIVIPRRIYNLLNTLHCVEYRDMQPEFRENVFAMVRSIFTETDKQKEYGKQGDIGIGFASV